MKTCISRSSAPHSSASFNLDVTRLEHENLYAQVSDLLEIVQRLEAELRRQHQRIAVLEGRGRDRRAR
ncbi:MAG TPA: hypothetical protein VMO26_18630 [Vicinamibacterales bacterium]|nr:hypothetical protein [Vicinamibacterales bacterium]